MEKCGIKATNSDQPLHSDLHSMTFGIGSNNITSSLTPPSQRRKLLEVSERSTKGVKYPKMDQNYILFHFVSNPPVICTFDSQSPEDETLPAMN